MKTTTWVLLAALTFLLGFFAGAKWNRRNIVSYREDGRAVAFDRRDPLFGLNLQYDIGTLRMMRAGMTNEVIERLEDLVDLDIEHAKYRYPVLKNLGEDRELAKLLAMVAEYRREFPRRLAQGVGFYLTVDKQKEIYAFLTNFTQQAHQNPIGKK